MSLLVFLAVLAAALAHAVWNAMIKVRLDRFASLTLMSIGMGVFALPFLAYVEVPQGITWLWIAASVAFHTGYRWFLVKAYETGDLAQSYPLARGTAPLLTTVGGIALLAEFPAPLTVGGIVLLSLGTLLMSFRGGSPTAAFSRRAVAYALVTSIFVASYTLTDGTGARSAATASSYAAWLFAFDAAWCLLLGLLLRGRAVVTVMIPEWRTGVVTGVLAAGSYWIAMWAMTQAPIAAVAALRETSILFAMLISVAVLREAVTPWRVAAALFIVVGVVALRLG
ncbi:MAG: DMT family transporter [Mesorhizobium sp.]|nr:DMT family transporter [Mesorhizobium sp.]